ncbi:MAG TPA: hypothetical protein VN519_06425 [Bryobacteraceae bacterium]|nr:hypothetical protein [Bryobacteraceae bacterium]
MAKPTINIPRDVVFSGAAFGVAQGYILAWGGGVAQPEPTVHELWLLPAMMVWFVALCYMLCRMTTKDIR